MKCQSAAQSSQVLELGEEEGKETKEEGEEEVGVDLSQYREGCHINVHGPKIIPFLSL